MFEAEIAALARHMAILAHFITPPTPVPAKAFQPTEKAVDSSFYV